MCLLKGKKGTPELWSATLIGPMVPSAHLDGRIERDNGHGASQWKPLREECTNRLKMKADKSVVYVSLGSMVSLIDEQMEEIAWGLKGSNLDFIWLVRNSEVNKLPSEFVDSTTEKVMEGERNVEIRKNASKWKRLAKEAISEGGSSDKCIDEFVEQLKSSRNNNG
ncbi:UDP-glycosyltransferase 74B1 [Camellia lanceoleosa]|uniref:UDP-glycosyltransferase 74B1 n=1 Tax=Camellia lanceoleosa TaxID=1840588 RepID=A0ACC0FRM2_9ERIC|nr:UDP-glycosyltransferase 74B1 [Camellia lanceoleosa]